MADSKKNSIEEQKNAFYKRLKDELTINTNWPNKYMYKFVMPNLKKNEEIIIKHFTDKKISKNYSKTGKYISFTILSVETKPEDIINKYKSLENIEGLIAL